MPAFSLEQFGGAIPAIGRRLLPENFAAEATNCDLISGELRGVSKLTQLYTFPATPSYAKALRFPPRAPVATETWVPLVSRRGVVIPYAVSNDASLRHVVLDGNNIGTPVALHFNTLVRMNAGNTGANAPYLLGIPTPTAPPVITATGGAGEKETRSYTYSYVDSFGQEGQPAAPAVATGYTDGSWVLTNIANPTSLNTSGSATIRTISTVRIYRTVYANSGIATYRRVADIAFTSTPAFLAFTDTVVNDVVVTAPNMESMSWTPPPSLEGVISGPGGILVGWAGRDVYFSVPYRPWAWPAEFTITTDYPILSCAYVNQTLVVVTESNPVFITGTDPSALSVARSDAIEGGISAPSIVAAPDGVYFSTRTGLMRASASGLQRMTDMLISESDWTTNYGSKIGSAARSETSYIGLATSDALPAEQREPGKGFLLNFRDPRVALTKISMSVPIRDVWPDPYTGELHGMANNVVYRWGDYATSGRETFLWRSKEFVFRSPINIASALVTLDVGSDTEIPWGTQNPDITNVPDPDVPVTIAGKSAVLNGFAVNDFVINAQGATFAPPLDYEDTLTLPDGVPAWMVVYANNRTIWQGPVYNEQLIRLPSGLRSSTWQISVVSSYTIRSIKLGTSAKALNSA
jgi:hypothetical protein